MAELLIMDPGAYCSLQDQGRFGYGRWGVPRAGTCFPKIMQMANHLVGNPLNRAGLEFFMKGPTLRARGGAVRLSVCAQASLTTSAGTQLSTFQSFCLQDGEEVRIGLCQGHKGGFIGVEGGFHLDPVLGSQSTYSRSQIGGYQGRLLQSGDQLLTKTADLQKKDNWMVPSHLFPEKKLRVILGPQDDYFLPKTVAEFFEAPFDVSAQSDRMGVRLAGPPLKHDPAKGAQIISDCATLGAIQVPGDGQPIVLLNDAQSVGGYPKIGCVLSCDLEALAQALPGQKLHFEQVSQEQGVTIVREDHRLFQDSLAQIKPVFSKEGLDPAWLYEHNLISGVIFETHKDDV